MLIKNEVLHDKVCPYLRFQGDKEMQLNDLIDWAKRYRCYHFKSTEPEKQYSKPKKSKKRYGGKSRSKIKTKVRVNKKKEV